MILIRVSFNPIMLFTEYCCNPHSLNYIFRSSAFSLNCNHTFFFHRFQQVSCLWIPEKWFLSAKIPAALLKPFTLSYRFNVFKVSWLNVSIWIFSFSLQCKISKDSSWSLQGNSSKLIFFPSNTSLENSSVSISIVAVSFRLYAFDLYKYGFWRPLFIVSFIVWSRFCVFQVYSLAEVIYCHWFYFRYPGKPALHLTILSHPHFHLSHLAPFAVNFFPACCFIGSNTEIICFLFEFFYDPESLRLGYG